MENRITSFLLPILIGIGGYLLYQSVFGTKEKTQEEVERQLRYVSNFDPEKSPSQIDPPKWDTSMASIVRRTAELGEKGFILRFSAHGGDLISVKLTDFYTQPGLTEEEKEDEENLYEIVDPLRVQHSFLIHDYMNKLEVKNPIAESEPMRLSDLIWEVTKDLAEEEGIRFRLQLDNGLIFEKDYLFLQGRREIQLVIRIKNNGFERGALTKFPYGLYGATALIDPPSSASFLTAPKTFASGLKGEEYRLESKSPDGEPNSNELVMDFVEPRFAYAGSSNRFFTCIIYTEDETTRDAIESVELFKAPTPRNAIGDTPPYSTSAPVLFVRQDIPRKGEAATELRFNIYLGPKDRDLFVERPEYQPFVAALDLDLETGCDCTPGAIPMAKLLLLVLKFFHGFLGNWGLSIILLTILVRASLMPLNLKQQKSMRVFQEKSNRLKPELNAIKEKYKNNKQKQNKAMMEFQRKHKLFPPLMGCLPMILTIPIFIGLFIMLRTSFELRHEPFAFWISDLSQPDRLFEIGGGWYFNLLPLLMMGLWTLTSFGSPLPDDPQQRQMQKMMRYMPLIFGVMLYNYASGLALYMTVSSLWAFCEQRYVRKKYGKVASVTPTASF